MSESEIRRFEVGRKLESEFDGRKIDERVTHGDNFLSDGEARKRTCPGKTGRMAILT